MSIHSIEVGKRYIKGKSTWPAGCEYNYTTAGHELRMFIERPSSQEIAAVTKGHVRLGFLELEDCLFFLFKLGTLPWSDAPYNWHRVPDDRRQVPQTLEPGEGALLRVVLVDASDGIVRGIRALRMGTDFSAPLHEAIARQIQRTGEGSYERAVDDAYKRFPDSLDMALSNLAVLL